MKKLLVVLTIIGVATPTAWGLYSTQQNAPAPARGGDGAAGLEQRQIAEWPLMRELRQINDLGVRLKRKINAYIYRDNRAARVAGLTRCYPSIGGGLIAMHTTLRRGGPDDVVAEIVNTSPADLARADISIRLYGKSGVLLGTTWTTVYGIRQGKSRRLRAVVSKFPLDEVASVVLEFQPAVHLGEELAGVSGQGCGHGQSVAGWEPAVSAISTLTAGYR